MYIKPPKAFEKLKKAEVFYAPVILSAASGYGKTAAVEYYYRRKNTLVLRCRSGFLKERPPIETIRQSVVVIEDLHWIRDDRAIRYVLDLVLDEGTQVVMLTRGSVPGWLAAEEMDIGLVRITEQDLRLDEAGVRAFFEEHGIQLSQTDAAVIAEKTRGYPLALRLYVNHMEQGEPFSADMIEAVWADLYYLWDHKMFAHMQEDFRNFALVMCRYEAFSLDMAAYMLGEDVNPYIEYSRNTMAQLSYRRDGLFSFRPEVRRFYCWKQEQTWSAGALMENYRRAADYYDRHGEISKALLYYKRAGASQRVKEILIRSAGEPPAVGQFIETKEYYFALPEEEVAKIPVLMAGMSMLCSLLLQTEQSETWYERLDAYAKNYANPPDLRSEARIRLAYLDIALPHRGIRGIIPIMRDVFKLMGEHEFALPELSVTGNAPSLMNGGLDFSEWSKSDTQIAKFMRRPVEALVGRYSKGLVTVALAESGFEKGDMSSYEVLTRCNDGFEAAVHGGSLEMGFAAVGVMARCHIIEGQQPSARRMCETFRERVALEKASHLEPNVEAFQVWISLFSGGTQQAEEFLKEAPDAHLAFSILDRYRQMIKLRCLIAVDRLDEALSLSDFLQGYFSAYDRHFYRMENEILKAVILYRKRNERWRDHLKEALADAAEYHFVRLVSMEGAAVLALLKELSDAGELSGLPDDYIAQVLDETQRTALSYPDYMKYIPLEEVTLTKRETEILSMLCRGMTTKEICESLDISYSGLKKHNRNIYAKLDAKDRAEAERRAHQLKLVHRDAAL